MKFDQKDIERFEAYLDNRMSLNKRKSFESQLSYDEDFKEKFEQYKVAVNMVRLDGLILNLREKIDENKK